MRTILGFPPLIELNPQRVQNFETMNKPKLTSKLLTLITGLILLNACSLVDLETPPSAPDVEAPIGVPQTEAAFMTALTNDSNREWRALTFTLEGLGVQQCRRDDTFIFFNDGTYRYDGGTLCGGADDRQIKTGVWELDFSNRQIVFDRGTSLETIATVSGLANNRIQLLGQVEIFNRMLDIMGIYEVSQ